MGELHQVDELLSSLTGHRESIEEKLLQEPEDDGLRDLLAETVEAIDLLEAEDAQAPLEELASLEARVAERLRK